MRTVLWILLTLVVVGGLTAIGASTRNASANGAAPTASAPATATPGPAEYHKLLPEEAKARIDSGDPVVIVDVRTAAEFAESRIPGAINVPNEEILDQMPEALPDKDAELLIYCRSGRRSSDAAHKLVAMGYTRVYDFGGIIDWPYETEQ
jgi:rhodanese-related sulfurtransferase